MNERGLPKTLKAFEVSEQAAKRFMTDNNALNEVARLCGVNRSDLLRLAESRKKLAKFNRVDHVQRRAMRRLREFLFPKPLKRDRGRPVRISPEDRSRIHSEADRLKRAGKTKKEILQALTAHYCLEPSYLLRIMEDARQEEF